MSEKHCLDVLAAYCLEALDPAEREEVISHLARCADCRREAVSVADCLHATFGRDCTASEPAPEMRTKFLARVALEMRPSADYASQVRTMPAIEATTRPLQRRPRLIQPQAGRRLPPMRWLLAAAVAIPTLLTVLFANAWINMNHQYADVKSQYNSQKTHLLVQALASPHVAMPLKGPATRQGMIGEVIVPKNDSGGLMILSGMTKPPTDKGYTCWIQRDGRWAFWGPLQPDASGLAMFVMDKSMDPHNATMMEITLEPMDRTLTTPSTPMLLSTPL
jgi:hypothetical protein